MKFQEAFLYLKLIKYKSGMQQISFVKFTVMLECVEMEPDRVCIMAEWPEPTCHSDIQVFLSFADFHRCFVNSFSRLAKSMTDMLKGEKNGQISGPIRPILAIKWSFVELHNAFTMVFMLAHLDPAKSHHLKTDASGFTIAGVIM